MSSGFFYETVAPLLCIGNTSFIAISTLTSDLNFYTKLISKMDPLSGKPVFKSIQIQLACQACQDSEKAFECMHMQHLIPRWQDQVCCIYGTFGWYCFWIVFDCLIFLQLVCTLFSQEKHRRYLECLLGVLIGGICAKWRLLKTNGTFTQQVYACI